MRILIAILSCRAHAAYQQAQRDTWIKDIPARVDLKYFVGHSENLAPDEVFLGEDAIQPERGLKLYPTLPDKIKLLCGWALDHGYDYLYKTDTDTAVSVTNLLNSGFESHDYSGGYNQETTGEFASGGAGYWLSRKAMQIVVNSTVASWAEDVFVALALKEKGVLPIWNSGYRWKPSETVDRGMISIHLGSSQHPQKYNPQMMYEAYAKMKAIGI